LLLRTGWLKDALEQAGIEVTVLPLERALDVGFLARLSRFLRDGGVDLFHSHEITFALYGRAATARLEVPHVATAHGRNFSRGWKRRGLGGLAFRAAGRFRLVAVSASLGDALSRDFALGRSAIQVVPNGIEMPPSGGARTREPGESLRVVAVGNLYPVKNHELLVRASSELLRRGIPVELDILGRGQEEPRLRALVEELGIGERVRLQGFRSDVAAFLARAHVFASSSLSEAMPLSFLEAMAHGLPIVASAVGGVPEIVRHGVSGLLFPSGSIEGAVEALLRIAGDEPLRRRLASRAATSVRGTYDADLMVSRYLDLYRTIAAA
jgi:glycosyltransferase involved in cell wall biosynthesis